MSHALPSSCGGLMSPADAAALIATGRPLCIAGEAELLSALPRGDWIGGTIPYFMLGDTTLSSREQVFVTPLEGTGKPEIRFYDLTSLSRICVDAPENGYTLIIIPAFSAAHSHFARHAPGFEGMYERPLAGWIAGTHLDDLATAHALVFDGRSGTSDPERAVVMHVALPAERYARVDIVNLMEPGAGAPIRFPETGFSAVEAEVNGHRVRLAEHLAASGADIRLPLVADCGGAMVNVSIKGIDPASGQVDFYAPVFDDLEYRLAAPPSAAARAALPEDAQGFFACNCVLNYVHSEFAATGAAQLAGPMTFGEIAYQLLNQTMVYLSVEDA